MKIASYTKTDTYFEFVGENGEKMIVPSVDVILIDDESGAISVKNTASRKTIGYYVKPTVPVVSCQEITSLPISSYTDTTYDAVYSTYDGKWYMLNNLNEYEPYGVYDIGESLSSFTYYPNKLVVVGTTEYQRSGDTWVEVGTYESTQTIWTVDSEVSPSPYIGETFITTFKIPKEDIDAIGGMFNLSVRGENFADFSISTRRYSYLSESGMSQGTVTNDSEYYYYAMESPSSIVVEDIMGMFMGTVRLVFGSMSASVEYEAKEVPTYEIYDTVEEMEAVGCPNVSVGEYAFVGHSLYKYSPNKEWEEVSLLDPKLVVFYSDGRNPKLEYCSSDGDIKSQQQTNPVEAYIGNCATSMGTNCCSFAYCPTLTSVTIGNNVSYIGSMAFENCTSLTAINIPSGVTSIDGNVLVNTSSLSSITVDENNTVYDSRNNCNAIIETETNTLISGCKNTVIPNTVITIGYSAFGKCRSLTSIDIPDSVTTINTEAFGDCSGLSAITIPSSVEEIDDYSFNGCWIQKDNFINNSGLDEVTNNYWGAKLYSELVNDIYINDNGQVIGYKYGITELNIPSGITEINNEVFESCQTLTSATIPDSVTYIGSRAFGGCNNLVNLSLGSGITTIYDESFRYCTSLSSVTIPDSVRDINIKAFDECSNLSSVTIGSGITRINDRAFMAYNNDELASVTIKAVNPPYLGVYAFGNVYDNLTIYVPSESVDAYKAASGWSNYADKIQAIP